MYIIDSTGPFFVKHPRQVINWSKVPHDLLEKKGVLPAKRGRRIRSNFETYAERVAGIGYTGISIDELSRLAIADIYPPKLKKKIQRYRRYYRRLFTIAGRNRLKVYITTDVMFFNRWITAATGGERDRVFVLLAEMLAGLFQEFPEIAGLIIRIGESDGVDVRGKFQSQLVVKTPADANALLRTLLPVFEGAGRTLIFRTWTVGAYEIGDLMWNRRTYEKVFAGIDSPNLVISMKYGESDFFRYLELNRHFLLDDRPKIIELQTRREYEGFGEYPAFVGREYAAIRQQLETGGARGVVGIQVWCQTGGWSRFRNFTFLKNTSYWNELNTHVTLKLFRDRVSVEDAVASFLISSGGSRGGDSKIKRPKKLKPVLKFLELADQVIHDLLYDPAFARRALYVNRARLPPLLHVFWDSVTINPALQALHLAFVSPDDARRSVAAGFAALDKIKSMRKLARAAGLPYDFRFHFDTFRLFALARQALYGPALNHHHVTENRSSPERTAAETTELANQLRTYCKRYRRRYPDAYRFQIDPTMVASGEAGAARGFVNTAVAFFLRRALRTHREYRWIDRVLFNPLTGRVYAFVFTLLKDRFPAFLNQQGMPLDRLLR